MKIDGGSGYPFASQHANANATRMDAKASFEALLAEKTERSERTATQAGSAKIEQADFTDMTRQELREWMGDQLRSGQMTVDESQPFLGWVAEVRIDQHGRAISGGGDGLSTERLNFFELLQGNRDFYQQRGDAHAASKIQDALDLMERSQDQITRFDARI
ncbi:hypothetical protein [Billgrantia endophytica]|uniref:Uncharacterized protein n=1 Tax=Billgrantia endophytica TaxID=2033802 RepID=A0A2N7U4G2_9GAMM|nr:hypothetical protein [Halomonas endophytica]PMR75322.1 hypothetical protein C1H69_10395 [Halomonas endophytica]